MRARILASLTLALALGSGCTLNVRSVDRTVESISTASYDTLAADLRSDASPGEIVVRGSARADSRATVTVRGLLPSDGDAEAVARGVRTTWSAPTSGTTTLSFGYEGPAAESVWLDALALDLPAGRALDLELGSSSIDIEGLGAEARVHAGSGSIDITDATIVDLAAGSGSIAVSAESGTIETGSGSIVLDIEGGVTASAGSGSIDGLIGGGGSLSADSGSIDVALTRALDADLRLETGSGSIHLIVPRGASMRLDLDAGSGSVDVDASGVDEHGESFVGTLGEGGFLVTARAGSGSISITEQ